MSIIFSTILMLVSRSLPAASKMLATSAKARTEAVSSSTADSASILTAAALASSPHEGSMASAIATSGRQFLLTVAETFGQMRIGLAQ